MSDEEKSTLRDYFAARAMQGLIAHNSFAGQSDAHDAPFCERAYKIADMMILAREGKLKREG